MVRGLFVVLVLLLSVPAASALWIPSPSHAFPGSVVWQPVYQPPPVHWHQPPGYWHPPPKQWHPPPRYWRPPTYYQPPPAQALPVRTLSDTLQVERLLQQNPRYCAIDTNQLHHLTRSHQTQRVFMEVDGREELVLFIRTDMTRSQLEREIGLMSPHLCSLLTYNNWRFVVYDI
jgi:hypothetical protein